MVCPAYIRLIFYLIGLKCICLFAGAFIYNMADDMDVPPLEDMSGVLEKVLSSRDIKTDNSSSSSRPVVASSGIANSDSCISNGRNSSSVRIF